MFERHIHNDGNMLTTWLTQLFLSVCLCPANILVFYFSAIRRDIDLKFIQDTYRVVLNSLKTN